MVFPYTRYSSSVLRPVIEIGIKHRRRSLRYDVLVDSGADIDVFNVELAEALGIELTAGGEAEVTGATGHVETVSIHILTLTVGARTYKAPVAFLASANPYGLVGQRGFFDQFVVAFDLPHERLEITPAPDL